VIYSAFHYVFSNLFTQINLSNLGGPANNIKEKIIRHELNNSFKDGEKAYEL
jgi:hypothetical protein